ncbi:hypothetical protein BC628DRAFT_1024576 [Trametes gibbosa]|nr:hypothetical protein BC628DRAFT_1024576 [Trametes gibbosa]
MAAVGDRHNGKSPHVDNGTQRSLWEDNKPTAREIARSPSDPKMAGRGWQRGYPAQVRCARVPVMRTRSTHRCPPSTSTSVGTRACARVRMIAAYCRAQGAVCFESTIATCQIKLRVSMRQTDEVGSHCADDRPESGSRRRPFCSSMRTNASR